MASHFFQAAKLASVEDGGVIVPSTKPSLFLVARAIIMLLCHSPKASPLYFSDPIGREVFSEELIKYGLVGS